MKASAFPSWHLLLCISLVASACRDADHQQNRSARNAGDQGANHNGELDDANYDVYGIARNTPIRRPVKPTPKPQPKPAAKPQPKPQPKPQQPQPKPQQPQPKPQQPQQPPPSTLVVPANSLPARIKMGVARANFVWEKDFNGRLGEIDQMAGLGIKMLRTDIRESDSIDRTVAVAKRAASHNIKMLFNIMQTPEDYTDKNQIYGSWVQGQGLENPTNKTFFDICGWEGGAFRLSTIDIELYRQRIVRYMEAFKKNNVTNLMAFEVGNEYDWACFNGDIEIGKPLDNNKISPSLVKYALMLKTAYQTIKSYYPQAIVVSQGLSNLSLRMNHSTVPAVNFMEWSRYAIVEDIYSKYCDVIGTHIYPLAGENQAGLVDNVLSIAAKHVPAGKGIWVTEMGYRLKDFGYNDNARFDALRILVDAVNKANKFNVINAFVYSFNMTGETFHIFDTQNNTAIPSSFIFHFYPY